MDTDTPTPAQHAGDADESYLRRAQALLAARVELFETLPAGSTRVAATPTAKRDGVALRERRAGRQLSLPLPRDRGRRRARMLG
jgi:hypothetical protein